MKPSKPSLTAAGALCALAALALHAVAQEGREPSPPQKSAPEKKEQQPESGTLRRIDPSAAGEDPARPDDLFARDFDAEAWKRRLAEPDLARREKSYDALLRRARLDPMARVFLEGLAGDDAGGELAWTARLALKELGRARFPLQGFTSSPFGPYPTDPFGGMQRMQGLMNELFAHEGLGHGLPRAPGAGRSVQLEQRDGRAVITITEKIDGQDSTRRYEGASVAEILAAHPELEPQLDGLLLVGPGGLDLRRFPGLEEPNVPLAPQARSRPLRTDRLGVVVQPLAAARARELGLEGGGLRVERTVAGSYAQLIGVDAGDVLLELDGKAVASGEDVEARMKARGADDPLTLVWLDELGQRHERTWRAPEQAEPARPR